MGDVLQFPSRARPRDARPLRAYRPPRGEVMKWENCQRGGGPSEWVVDWWANSEDSVCMMGRFATEVDADAYIARWNRDHPLEPGGGA